MPITLSTFVANTRKQMEDDELRLQQQSEQEFTIHVIKHGVPVKIEQ